MFDPIEQYVVDGVSIQGRPRHDVDNIAGFYLEREGVSGLDDGTDIRRAAVDRPDQHGEFDVPSFQSARVLSFSGVALAGDVFELAAMRDRVMGIGADGEKVTVSAARAARSVHTSGRLGARSTFKELPWSGRWRRARFQVQIVCVDPRLYGEKVSYGPAVTVDVHHRGNFPALPVVDVRGTMSGYSVWGPANRRFVVTRPITTGEVHRFDLRTGRLFVDGALVAGDVSRAQTWAVPPGPAAVTHTLIPTSGAGTLTVHVADTWI